MTSAASAGKPGFFESALTKLIVRSTTVCIAVALTGCGAVRIHSSNDEHRTDGSWTRLHTPYGWAWCRQEVGTERCVLER
jgi:hypothetical protein